MRDALDIVFQALASSPNLRSALVYKGARVLALRLGGEQRASYDLDANLLLSFAQKFPSRADQTTTLEHWISEAIEHHLETQDPIRYELQRIKVVHRPRDRHPLGWNAFDVTVNLVDHANEGVLGLPKLEFDVAAPESLGEHAIAPLKVGDETVFAYTLERIAGEKMRAFLSTLPTYRKKVQKPGEAIRVKDLYDLTKILGAHPIDEAQFWTDACSEFRLACESRYIDCRGIETFAEDLAVSRNTYETDATTPKDIPFNVAWKSIETIVGFWTALSIFPLIFPLPKK